MKKSLKRLVLRFGILALGSVLLGATAALVGSRHYAVLDASGTIATQQKRLLIFASILSLAVIVPVFVLLFHIVRTYRVGDDGKAVGRKARYHPDWEGSNKLEALWWGIPGAIILVLSVVTWQTSHSLDPYRAIKSDQQALQVQVVALPWKWLFIYPEQQVATVNYLQLPVGRPVSFRITADAPMNSFWIPQLGGQVYAMTGMSTQLHLQADKPGSYRGVSANLSGDGFAGMHFMANAVNEQDFATWVDSSHNAADRLDYNTYSQLALPSSDEPEATYGLADDNLYDAIVAKYSSHMSGMQGMTMNNEGTE